MPLRLIDDEKQAAEARRRTPWYCYGRPSYVIDQLQQYFAAGAEEIMLAGVVSDPQVCERIDAEVLSAFD